jgi:hypothetical protein
MRYYSDFRGALILSDKINIKRLAELTYTKPQYVQKVVDDLKVKVYRLGLKYFERFDDFEPNHREGSFIFREHGISESKEFTGGDRQVMAYLALLIRQKG